MEDEAKPDETNETTEVDAEGGGDEDGEWGVTLVENSANRSCTDIVFLALFVVAFIALITVLTTVAFRKGDITKFVAGKDHDGFTCGVDPLVAQFPYTYYPHTDPKTATEATTLRNDPVQGMMLSRDKKNQRAVCTSECPQGVANDRPGKCPAKDAKYCNFYGTSTMLIRHRYCIYQDPFAEAGTGQQNCVDQGDVVTAVLNDRTTKSIDSLTELSSSMANPAWKATIAMVIGSLTKQREEVRQIIATESAQKPKAAKTECADRVPGSPTFTEVTADLMEEYAAYLVAAGASVVTGLIYLILVRFCARVLIILSTLAVFGGCIAGFAISLQEYNRASDLGLSTTGAMSGMALFGVGALIVFIIILGFFFGQSALRLAAALLEIGLSFLLSMPSLLFLAVVTVALQIGWFFFMVYCILLLVSTMKVKPAQTVEEEGGRYEYGNDWLAQIFFAVLMMFWFQAYLKGILSIACSHGVGQWYFSVEKEVKTGQGFISYGVALFYHSGTAAFGGLIMAIVYVIQLVLTLFQWIASFTNPVCGCCVCCALCIVNCVQRAVEAVSTAVYALCGLEGTNFCMSGIRAFMICKAHPSRFGVVAGLATMVENLGVLLVMGGGSAAAYFFLARDLQNIQSVTFPLILAIILSYLLGCTLMSLIVTVSESLFFAFIADEAIAKSKGGESEYTPEELKILMDTPEKLDEEKGSEKGEEKGEEKAEDAAPVEEEG